MDRCALFLYDTIFDGTIGPEGVFKVNHTTIPSINIINLQ